MKLIIAGGRDFNLKGYEGAFAHYLKINNQGIITEIVSGGARGADKLGELLAKNEKLPVKLFEADWDTHGKSAGYIRNSEMADYGDILLAFWDGKSKGTKHMIDLATKKGLEVRVVRYTVRYEDAKI